MDKHSLELLEEQLPSLAFDLQKDGAFTTSKLAQEYLTFYGIDFSVEFDGLKHGFGSIESATNIIAVQYFHQMDAKKTVFVVHGYYDHAGLYGHLIRELLSHKYNVVIFDLPGHGLSTGTRASIECFGDYTAVLESLISKVNGLFPQPWCVLGQSTGAAVVLDYIWCCREKESLYPFSKTVLLAPLVRARGWKQFGWALPVFRNFKKSFKRGFSPSSHDQEFLNFIANHDPLQCLELPTDWIAAMGGWVAKVSSQSASDVKVSIIQGDSDQTVDWQFNLRVLWEKFPSLELQMVPGARHHLVCESDRFRQQVFSIVINYLQQI